MDSHEVSIYGMAPEDIMVVCSCGKYMEIEDWGTQTTLQAVNKWHKEHQSGHRKA